VEELQLDNTNTIATAKTSDKFFIDFSAFGSDANLINVQGRSTALQVVPVANRRWRFDKKLTTVLRERCA
jgi:hypothetical protein